MALTRWYAGFIGLLVWLQTTLAFAGGASATYCFTEYRAGRSQNRLGHWLEFTLTIPKGSTLADRNRTVLEFLDYWLLTREGALEADPAAVIASVNLEVDDELAHSFVDDLLRFRGGEVVLRITGYFEAMADQNQLSLDQDAIIRFRQFLPLQDPQTLAREKAAGSAFGLPPSMLNQKRRLEPEQGDEAALDADETAQQKSEAREFSMEMNLHQEEVATETRGADSMSDRPAAAGPSAGELDNALAARGSNETHLRADAPSQENRPNQLLDMNSRNLIASLLSYRSELGELPPNLETLAQSGHILLSLQDPVTRSIWRPTNNEAPGGMAYERLTASIGMVKATPSTGPIRRLKVETAPIRENVSATGQLGEGQWSPEEQHARRAIFQIAKLLELFYSQFGYLPSSVPQIELLGFAHIGFPNLLSGRMTVALPSPTDRSPGDYFYYRTAANEFLLIGYGRSGRTVISIRQPLAEQSQAPSAG